MDTADHIGCQIRLLFDQHEHLVVLLWGKADPPVFPSPDRGHTGDDGSVQPWNRDHHPAEPCAIAVVHHSGLDDAGAIASLLVGLAAEEIVIAHLDDLFRLEIRGETPGGIAASRRPSRPRMRCAPSNQTSLRTSNEVRKPLVSSVWFTPVTRNVPPNTRPTPSNCTTPPGRTRVLPTMDALPVRRWLSLPISLANTARDAVLALTSSSRSMVDVLD